MDGTLIKRPFYSIFNDQKRGEYFVSTDRNRHTFRLHLCIFWCAENGNERTKQDKFYDIKTWLFDWQRQKLM